MNAETLTQHVRKGDLLALASAIPRLPFNVLYPQERTAGIEALLNHATEVDVLSLTAPAGLPIGLKNEQSIPLLVTFFSGGKKLLELIPLPRGSARADEGATNLPDSLSRHGRI